MKRLLIDIETAPNVVASFRVWQTNISPKDVITTGYTLCWSAKWLGERGTQFDSIHKSDPLKMLTGIWTLLDEADAVISYNGSRFDSPTLSKEFLKHGLMPPSPYKHIDLLLTVSIEERHTEIVKKFLQYAIEKLPLDDTIARAKNIIEKIIGEKNDLITLEHYNMLKLCYDDKILCPYLVQIAKSKNKTEKRFANTILEEVSKL